MNTIEVNGKYYKVDTSDIVEDFKVNEKALCYVRKLKTSGITPGRTDGIKWVGCGAVLITDVIHKQHDMAVYAVKREADYMLDRPLRFVTLTDYTNMVANVVQSDEEEDEEERLEYEERQRRLKDRARLMQKLKNLENILGMETVTIKVTDELKHAAGSENVKDYVESVLSKAIKGE